MDGEKVVRVSRDPDSPASRGFIRPKGAVAPEMPYHPDRLKYPLRRIGARGENRWEWISRHEAITEIAERFDRIRRESGLEYLAVG